MKNSCCLNSAATPRRRLKVEIPFTRKPITLINQSTGLQNCTITCAISPFILSPYVSIFKSATWTTLQGVRVLQMYMLPQECRKIQAQTKRRCRSAKTPSVSQLFASLPIRSTSSGSMLKQTWVIQERHNVHIAWISKPFTSLKVSSQISYQILWFD